MEFPAILLDLPKESLVVFLIRPIIMDQSAQTASQAPGCSAGMCARAGTDGIEFRGRRVERAAERAVKQRVRDEQVKDLAGLDIDAVVAGVGVKRLANAQQAYPIRAEGFIHQLADGELRQK